MTPEHSHAMPDLEPRCGDRTNTDPQASIRSYFESYFACRRATLCPTPRPKTLHAGQRHCRAAPYAQYSAYSTSSQLQVLVVSVFGHRGRVQWVRAV